MSFIEDYDVIVNKKDILYRRIGNKKMFLHKITEKDLDEGTMVNFPYTNLYFSFKCETENVPNPRKFLRSGVIPFTVNDGKKFFCLGIDEKYGTLTDFGGGVKRGEHFLDAACRELEEESLGIFDFRSESCIEKLKTNSITIHDCNTAIVFINIHIENMNEIVKLYNKRYSDISRAENSGIIWIPEDIFFYLIKSGKTICNGKHVYPSVYKVVNDLLRSVSNINEIL
jgi:hypothetical protein